jgi:capsular polysaccharide biosynthesis protein
MWPKPTWSIEKIVTFTAKNILITNYFALVDLNFGYFFRNQTYSSVLESFLPSGCELTEDRFKLSLEAKHLSGRYVVIGGPVDGNWWHWLYSWCPRLMLLWRLRPELFADPDVRFIVHPLAMTGTFRPILDAFGVPESRLLPIDPKTAHVLEEAALVSFCDQELLYPALMQAFATHVRQALGVTRRSGPGRRVFASRQGHPRARRRVQNWAETASVLNEHHVEIHSFGDLDARDQVQIFTDADVVVAVHGSDLSGLMFCRPGTKVLVFETRRNIDIGLYLPLEWLCKLFDLDYTRHSVEEVEAESSEPTPEMLLFNRDVTLDASALQAIRGLFADAAAYAAP